MPRASINRKQKKRVKPRFYVLIAVALGMAALAAVIIINCGEGSVTTGAVALDMDISSVVIRDETMVTVEKFDRVTFKINEGTTVTEGVPVADVYKWGYSDDMMTSLITLQTKILEAQEALLDDVEMPELDAVKNEITAKQDAIRAAVLSDSGADLLQLETELSALLAKRIEYLKTNVQPNSELNDLYAEEEAKKTQLASWKSEIASKGSGVISFYFDGYESMFSADKIDMISAELVNTAVKGGSTASVTSEDRLYRLVDSYNWYIAFVTPSSSPLRVAEGQDYTVVFEGYTEKPYTGVALAPIVSKEGGGIVNILRFKDDIGGLMSVRSVRANISRSASGTVVPVEDIIIKDGVTCVEMIVGNSSYMMEVSVLAADEKSAVVAPVNPLDSIVEGMRYKKPQ